MTTREQLDHIKAAVTAHNPEENGVQWYVDEHVIDVDADELWAVVERALAAIPPSDARILAWIEDHPEWFATWVRKQDRITGGAVTRGVPRGIQYGHGNTQINTF